MDRFTIKEILGFLILLQTVNISVAAALIFDAVTVRKEIKYLYQKVVTYLEKAP